MGGKLNVTTLKWQDAGSMKGLGFRDGVTMAVRCKTAVNLVGDGEAGEEKAEKVAALTEKENSKGIQSPWRGNVAFVKRKERGISIKKWEGPVKGEGEPEPLRTESA